MSNKKPTSIKRSKTLISSNIIFKKMNILEENSQNYSSKYYISLIISNLHPQNTKILKFDEKGEAKINQIMSLKNEEPKKKLIKLELYEKDGIYSDLLLKGEIVNENYLYDNASDDFVCYLFNSENEEKAVIHYDIEYDSVNKDDLYELNVKRIEKVNERKNLNENNIHHLFMLNLQYIKLISNDIHSLLNWNDKWRTLSYLFGITFIILFFKIFYILFLPLCLIFIHIKNKNNIEKFIVAKANANNQKNKEENNFVLFKFMYGFNKVIKIYENILKKIINGNQLVFEFYIRLGISLLVNFCVFYFRLFYKINFKILFLGMIWIYILRKNPSFYSFNNFIFNLLEERTLFLTTNTNYYKYKTNLINLITIMLPFYSLYRLYVEEDVDNSQLIENREERDNNIIKYEIYENERWWMFVGWNKNLISDESIVWYKKDKPKEYCDKSMIKLLDNDYKWESDWKIEINDNSDKYGWEYSKDFENEFQRYDRNQYVRRRKWVRYAIKKVMKNI